MQSSTVREVRPSPLVGVLESSSISWRAIFAGTLIALLVFAILISLGVGVGGATLQSMLRGNSAEGFGVGTAIWLVASFLVSLFIGGYFSGQVAGIITRSIGAAQGMSIAGLFFLALLSQVIGAVGLVGRGLGSLGRAAGQVAGSEQVQQVVNDALQGGTLKAPVGQVAQGIATRLLQGDTEGAKDYLVSQSTLTQVQADQAISTVQQRIGPTLNEAGRRGAGVLKATGWTLFFSLTLGTLASVVGGTVGARSRIRHPGGRSDEVQAA
jgi:hypothetical protein